MQKYLYQVQQCSPIRFNRFLLNIIGLKSENGLPCDFFLAEAQPCSQGLYQFRQNTQFPRIFGQFARKSEKTFSLGRILSHGRLGEKAGILRCKRMETIINFRETMTIQPSFYY